LLEPDEEVYVGDEWLTKEGRWIATVAEGFKPNQYTNLTFRRRTTPQYVPYTWDDREELRGKWFKIKGDEVEFQAYEFNIDQDKFYINSILAKDLFEYWEYLDGSPCGKKVV
jgi:hypothetical protein